VISGNSADDYGGAIHCYASSPTITNCTITNNAAYGGGGGVYCTQESNPTIGNCTITGNTADDGGGVYCRGSSPTITNCTVTGNTATFDGGGIFCWESSPTITNCTICDNVADAGGGACCYDCTLTITNCTIAGNTASKFGGGIFCWESSPTITNCTISGNTAHFDGGGVCCGQGSPTITNCILWGDTPQEIYVISSQPVVSYGDVQGGWEGTGNIDEDPLFVDPDGPDDDPNTWEDNDYHLSPASPCIDAGCNVAVPPDTADLDSDDDTTEQTPLDLDGEGRFFDDPDTPNYGCCGEGVVVDMGAYEYGGTGPQPCPGDLDGDQDVDHSDLGMLLSDWGCDYGDLDCSGHTDQADLGILLAHWGDVCP